MNFTINPDFERLIPPLSTDERSGLENLILADGIQSPLIIARYPNPDGEELLHLADGHNRYRIAQKHGLTYNTIVQDFASEDDVVIWMVDNQKGRRNLTDFVKLELAEVKAERLRAKGREKISKVQEARHAGVSLSIIDKDINEQPHNTRNVIASDLGWSTGKVAMAQKVMSVAPEEVKEQLRAGEVSINQAYNEIKKAEKESEIQKRKEEVAAQVKETLQMPVTEFGLIYADPPWRYDFSNTQNRDIENHYPTMTTEDICNMQVPAAKDCVLYMWATAPKLIEAMQVIKAWGFEYKTHLIWDKETIGMGYWFRGQHELLMVATRGSVSPPESSLRISSVFREKKTQHSRKPHEFYNHFETWYPELTKVELFARNDREGWYSWGNQL